jgi:hypothetical protein
MKNIKSKFILLHLVLFSILIANCNLLADSEEYTRTGNEPNDIIDNKFYIQSFETVPNPNRKENYAEGFLSNKAVNQFLGTAMPFNDSRTKNVEEGRPKERRSEEKTSTLTQQLPLQGNQILLHSEAMKNMYDRALDGQVALHKITMQQVEPAVAAGAQGAETSTALAQLNMYNSQILRWNEYMSDPDMYKQSMGAFQKCMYDKTKNNPGSWIKALQVCSGDAVAESSSEVNGFSDATGNQENAFSGKDHPDNKRANGKQAAGNKNEIKVSDMIFAALKNSNNTPVKEVDRFLESWKQLFGDYVISIEVAKDQNTFFPLREGKRFKIYPSREPQDYMAILAKARFKDLMDVLYNYCEAYDKKQIKPNSSWYAQQLGGYNILWVGPSTTGKKNTDRFRALSFPGVTFSQIVLDSLMEPYLQNFSDIENEDIRVDCQPLRKYKNGDFSDVANKLIINYLMAYKNYAEYVAYAQTVNTWLIAEKFIKERTAGLGFNDELREYALKLIYDVANTNNIPELQHAAVDGVMQTLTLLKQGRAQETGMSAPVWATNAGLRVKGSTSSSRR